MGKIDFQPLPQANAKSSIDFQPLDEGPKEESFLDKPLFGDHTARSLLSGGLKTLPAVGTVAGGAVGGLLGAGAGGVGAAPGAVYGAGLGAGAGKAIESAGEALLEGRTGKPSLQGMSQVGSDIGKEMALGSASEVGGQALPMVAKGLVSGAKKIPYVEKAGEALGNAGAKVGELFTSVPKKVIQTYAKNAEEIKDMARASDNSVAEAADQMRSQFAKSIDNARFALNKKISNALSSSKEAISAEPILSELEAQKAKINSKLYPEAAKEIDSLSEKIRSLMGSSGELSLKDAHDVKSFLQDEATSAYRNPGEATIGTKAANAAKFAARKARELVNKAAPNIAEANDNLSHLHDIEDNMNINLIREGKPESGLVAAGTGGNPRNAKALKLLGEATGTDMLGSAEKLAAMKEFGSPRLMSNMAGHNAFGRVGLGAAIGGIVGENEGGHWAPGMLAGAALTSPAALRTAIDSGLLGKEAIDAALSSRVVTEEGKKAIIQSLLSPQAGRNILMQGLLRNEGPSK